MTPLTRVISICAVCLPLLAAPALAQERSLYQRLGGYDAIAQVTDAFIARFVADDRLKRLFAGLSTDSRTRIRQHLIDYICAETGGPCVYGGRSMKRSHSGSGITRDDWERTNGHFAAVFAEFELPEREQKELFALFASLKADIVEQDG